MPLLFCTGRGCVGQWTDSSSQRITGFNDIGRGGNVSNVSPERMEHQQWVQYRGVLSIHRRCTSNVRFYSVSTLGHNMGGVHRIGEWTLHARHDVPRGERHRNRLLALPSRVQCAVLYAAIVEWVRSTLVPHRDTLVDAKQCYSHGGKHIQKATSG